MIGLIKSIDRKVTEIAEDNDKFFLHMLVCAGGIAICIWFVNVLFWSIRIGAI